MPVLVSFAQQSRGRDQAKEEPIYAQLREIQPKAVETFRLATEALDGGRPEDASTKFGEVLKAAPDFEPALRRLGYSQIALGDREQGLKNIEKALALNRSADNLSGLAYALVTSNDPSFKPSEPILQRAHELLVEAISKGDNDFQTYAMKTQVELWLNKAAEFKVSATRLSMQFPDEGATHYFMSLVLADDGDFDGARKEIDRATQLGLDPESAAELRAAFDAAEKEAYPMQPYLKYLYFYLGLVALWAVGLLALYVFGRVLSTRTLAAIESLDPNDVSGVGHASLRATYRKLINFASIYYYISQPMMVLVVVGSTAGFIYLCLLAGRIPVVFILGLIFVGGGSIFYMFKSLIFRPKIEDPGRPLTTDEAPGLWDLVQKVAADLDTRPVDEIRVTPGTELAVYERGGFFDKMNEKAERILIVGVGSLNGFSTNGFRAVLAHEYGHLSNRDTAGGDIAFRVNSDMWRLAEAMVNSGTNTYHNLAFHFLRLYHFIFRRITHGASRLQEVLADHVAVHNYGSAAFADGLSHVVRQSVVFEKLAESEISGALWAKRAQKNLYDLAPSDETSASEIENLVKEQFQRPTTEDDTHPAPSDRIRLAQKITGQTKPDLPGEVWQLFADREKFTAEMNRIVEETAKGYRSESSTLSA